MKVLVGTLYAGEPQFSDCCAAIRAQSYAHFEHIIIRDLSKKDAHEALYGTFMEQAGDFHLLIKVDADLVLQRSDLFERIVARFQAERELDLLLIAVHDFFTDKLLMAGMQTFRNTVQWDLGTEHLLTDMTYVQSSVRRMVTDYRDLAPAGVHCPNPTLFQAFHYGFHRGIKTVWGKGRHWKTLFWLWQHYRRSPNPHLAAALLGGNTAFDPRFQVRHISYTDDTLASYFQNTLAGLDPLGLHTAARKCKLYRTFFVCRDWRIVAKLYRFKSKFAS